jgi:hypothetical protein
MKIMSVSTTRGWWRIRSPLRQLLVNDGLSDKVGVDKAAESLGEWSLVAPDFRDLQLNLSKRDRPCFSELEAMAGTGRYQENDSRVAWVDPAGAGAGVAGAKFPQERWVPDKGGN